MNKLFKQFCFVLCLSGLSLSALANNSKTTDNQVRGMENLKIQTGALVVWDYDDFDGVHNQGKERSTFEIRRAQLQFKAKFGKNWESKFQIQIKNEVEWKDAYVKYKGWDNIDLTLGKAKEPFGLETLNSSKYTDTIEHAMASQIFSPGRSYGVTLFGQIDHFTFASGLYTVEQDDDNDETQAFALTGRITYAPIIKQDAIIHLGLAGSYRDTRNNTYQLKGRLEVHQAEKFIRSAITPADNQSLFGLEAANVWGAFSFQTEYMRTFIHAKSNADIQDVTYSGYYIQATYFLTGEHRAYKKGIFGKVKPRSKYGAWQLVSRLSQLDATGNNEGIEAKNMTFGVNCYLNHNIRLSANYINTDIKGPDAVPGEKEANALSFRVQYLF